MTALGDFSVGGITFTPVPDVHLIIAGVDRTNLVRPTSISVEFGLGERATASFNLIDTANSYEPKIGNEVFLYLGESLVFAGSIERTMREVPLGTSAAELSVTCVDYAQILDRRLIARTFETTGQTAGDIVREIVAILYEDGIGEGTILEGATVSKAVFPYVSATEAIGDLADLSGVVWWIDSSRRVNFAEQSLIAAPWSITNSSRPYRNMVTNSGRDQLKNHIFLRAGRARTEVQTEDFVGDGVRQTFTVGFPLDEKPRVYVGLNGGAFVEKTVGIRGIDDGEDFFWNLESTEITQKKSATPLDGNDLLRVVYYGTFPLILESYDPGSISERQIAEGGSGSYEALEEDERIDDRKLAEEKLGILLRKYKDPTSIVTFETFSRGLSVGQVLPITVAEEKLSGEFLVTRLRISIDLTPAGALMLTSATVDAGKYKGGWVQFFRDLEKRGKRFGIREDEQLGLGPTKFETFTVSDSYNTTDPLENGDTDPYTGVIIWADGDENENKYAIGTGKIGA